MFATPANPSAAILSPNPWATASASPPRDTVLIAEDEDPIAGLLTCILERGGFRVLRARDARECTRLFAAHVDEIAVVLLDGTLPDVHGAALSGQLRERSAGLPILFVSGRDLTKVRDALAADGPTAFVSKPFLPPEILRQVRTLIGATV